MIESVHMEQKRNVYCANCIHCKLVKTSTKEDQYILRVRCHAGKWRKRLGGEKLYKYFTVARRLQDYCDAYTPMGELKPFMKELRASLPTKDEVYDNLSLQA